MAEPEFEGVALGEETEVMPGQDEAVHGMVVKSDKVVFQIASKEFEIQMPDAWKFVSWAQNPANRSKMAKIFEEMGEDGVLTVMILGLERRLKEDPDTNKEALAKLQEFKGLYFDSEELHVLDNLAEEKTIEWDKFEKRQ